MPPSLSQLIECIRQSAGLRKDHIDENTLIEDDLDITGGDGSDLLEDVEEFFGISLHTGEEGYRQAFSLGENEYLFHSEGVDFFGICRFLDWLRGIEPSVIRKLTVGELHQVLVTAYHNQGHKAAVNPDSKKTFKVI